MIDFDAVRHARETSMIAISVAMVHTLLVVACTTSPDANEPPGDPGVSTKPVVYLSDALLPEGVADEDAYATWLTERTASMLKAAAEAEDLAERIETRLAAVNWMLASECEPPMSRWLYGVDRDESARRVQELTDRARQELAIVRAEWERFVELPDYDGKVAFEYESAIGLLDAFAQAMHACVDPATTPEAAEASRSAARGLSEYLEDARPTVSAAAALFKGVLYGRTDQTDRALRLWSLPAKPPNGETLHYEFFAKLLRCRFLARQGSYAAAWRLLLSIEEHAEKWFVTLRGRAEARRSAALVKFDICREWAAADTDDARSGSRLDRPHSAGAWCRDVLDEIRREQFPDDGEPSVIRLTTAAPLVITLPAPENEAPAPSPQTPAPDVPSEPEAPAPGP